MVGYNDAWVMSAWSKANGVKDDDILFLADEEAKFSKSIGLANGPRLARYAIALDHGRVVYIGKDEPGELEVMRPRLPCPPSSNDANVCNPSPPPPRLCLPRFKLADCTVAL